MTLEAFQRKPGLALQVLSNQKMKFTSANYVSHMYTCIILRGPRGRLATSYAKCRHPL